MLGEDFLDNGLTIEGPEKTPRPCPTACSLAINIESGMLRKI